MVVTQAHVQQPLRAQLEGVEHVERAGLAVGGGAGVVANSRRSTDPSGFGLLSEVQLLSRWKAIIAGVQLVVAAGVSGVVSVLTV